MDVRLGMITRFDATAPDEVIRNFLSPSVLIRSHPSKVIAHWKRYVRPEFLRVYFFDDLRKDPAELRCSILLSPGGRPDQGKRQIQPEL